MGGVSLQMTLGEHIRDGRKAKKLSQRALAALVRVHVDTVSGWENDEHTPRPAELRALKRILPMPAEFVPIASNPERLTRDSGHLAGTGDADVLDMALHKVASLIEHSLKVVHGPERDRLMAGIVLQIAAFLADQQLPNGDLLRYAGQLLTRETKSDASIQP